MTQRHKNHSNDSNTSKSQENGIKNKEEKFSFLDLKMTGEPLDKITKVSGEIGEKDIFVTFKCSTDLNEFVEEQTTGTEENIKRVKEVHVPFDKYIVKVGLSSSNEFLGITEIEIHEDFRSDKEKVRSKVFYDVVEYYEE
ncbi:hypothetical protein ES705_32747 [subsurface metagenome]